MMTSLEWGMDLFMDSATAGGVIASASPTMMSVGMATEGQQSRKSLRSRMAARAYSMGCGGQASMISLACCTRWGRVCWLWGESILGGMAVARAGELLVRGVSG